MIEFDDDQPPSKVNGQVTRAEVEDLLRRLAQDLKTDAAAFIDPRQESAVDRMGSKIVDVISARILEQAEKFR